MHAGTPEGKEREPGGISVLRFWRVFFILSILWVLIVPGLFGRKEQYCKICGMRRSAVCIRPIIATGEAREISWELRQTEISRVILPLLPGGSCAHQWVTLRPCPTFPSINCGCGLYHESHMERRFHYLTESIPDILARVARADEQLACAMARRMLFPYADPSEFDRERQRFFEVGASVIMLAGEDPERVGRLRQLYGLPAGR